MKFGNEGQKVLSRKPEACPHRSRWLSARQGATPPGPAQKRPDPGGITALCDPAGVGGTVDDKPVVSPANAGSTTGYGAVAPIPTAAQVRSRLLA